MRTSGMSFFLCAIVIVVSAQIAVDVPDFFEELPRLLTSLTNSTNSNPLLSRVARQTRTSVPCCGEVKFVFTPIADEYNSCMEEIRDLDKEQKEICASECAGKKLELCDDEGYVKKELFVEFSKRFVDGDDTLGDLVKAVAANMVEAARALPKDKRNTQCNIDMYLVFAGTYFNMELYCPSELQNKASECEKLRASFRKLSEKMRG